MTCLKCPKGVPKREVTLNLEIGSFPVYCLQRVSAVTGMLTVVTVVTVVTVTVVVMMM